ncbi:MAG: glycosyltransferase [Sneathiella sp.]|nr:glycosyltransferase [Sneathiella sp.]
MKIMQAIGGAGHGGAETFFVYLAGAFKRADFEQLVAMRSNMTRREQLREQGIDPLELKFGGTFDFFTKPKLQRLADDFRPDIYMSWMSRASNMIPSGNFPKVARLGGYYNLKYYKKCDHLVGNTEDICQYLIRSGWPAEKTHYIPNFVKWEETAPIDRATLDTPDDATVLLALGRLHQNKAFDIALKVLAKQKNSYLWIGGAGNLLEELKSLAKELNVEKRVRFLGWRTDKESLFAAADICLYPSRIEPFGNVTLDAWASGTPIIAAASAGPAAYITHEVNGLLSPVDDPETMSSHVQQLIDNVELRHSLIEKGKEEYNNKFTEQAAISNWNALFSSILHH